MKKLLSLFRPGLISREAVITRVSGLGLVVNILIGLGKIAIGAAAGSIAIISDGIHSGADAATSLLTMVGVKLAGKKPTAKHPFGFGRIEYLTSLLIGGLILFTGWELMTEGIAAARNPVAPELSLLSLLLIALSAAIKFVLGLYTIRQGKAVDSVSLVGLGTECRNDAFASIITIASAAVFLLFQWNLDAWAGIATSLLILKAGAEVLLATLSDLLGRSGDRELASALYRRIRATPGILNAADMMLHNYGPDAWSASVNIELDHSRSLADVYRDIHALQLAILEEYRVTMVFGIYAVDDKTPQSREMRGYIGNYVKSHGHLKGFHALYHDREQKKIYCDLVVDYDLPDWDALQADFTAYMAQKYPEDTLMLTVETEYV